MSPAEIKLADAGVASAYVVLPSGELNSEVKRLQKLASTMAAAASKMDADRGAVTLTDMLYLTGQADLVARFSVPDFRNTLEIPYPSRNSRAHVLNWIFAVPAFSVGNFRDPSKTLRFVMHLRLRRSIYRSHFPVRDEQLIIGFVRDRLVKAGCVAQIGAGLGWSDYIIEGGLDPAEMRRFDDFLVEIHEGCVTIREPSADGEGEPKTVRLSVFVRTMTLVGFPLPLDEGQPVVVPVLRDVTPVRFVRAAPGRIYQAIADLADGEEEERVRFIDGKSDFVVLPNGSEPDVLRTNMRLSDPPAGTEPPKMHIQRLETHLIFAPVRKRTGPTDEVVVFDADEDLRGSCRCGWKLLDLKMSDWLSKELTQSVQNALFLSDATVRDEMTCCDVAQAVKGAEEALKRMSKILDERHALRQKLDAEYRSLIERGEDAEVKATERQIVRIGQQITKRVHDFELWHLFFERVLRQRTVSSFEELLLRSDRNVVFRGSVQKFLLLADALMNDFAITINGGHPVPARLWAMYDSTTRIFSHPVKGLVRIPARHLFRLPTAVPDLWHEVGVYWFFWRVPRETLFRTVPPGEPEQVVSEQEYDQLGDSYGDLVVYHIGFAGDWRRFVVSLASSWLDSHDRTNISEALYERDFTSLLTRLVLVLDVSNRWEDVLGLGIGDRLHEPEARAVIERTYDHLRGRFGTASIPELTPVILTQAMGDLLLQSGSFGATLAKRFRETVRFSRVAGRQARKSHAARIAQCDGHLIPFSMNDDMNALFGELFWYLREKPVDDSQRSSHFRLVATIVRSALTEYHRRQAW